jgi:hypothetical protein
MGAAQITSMVEIVVCLIFLLVLFLRLLPAYRLDSFRQNVFALRDELFDYAAAGNISFNDPAYRLLRQSMNGFIRYAHQLSLFRLVFTFEIWKYRHEKSWADSWEKALKNVNRLEVRRKLNEFHERSLVLVMDRIVTGSPILILALAFTFLIFTLHQGFKNLKETLELLVPKVGSKFVNPRALEEAAARAAA